MACTKCKLVAGIMLTLLFSANVSAVTLGSVLPLTGPNATIGEDQQRGIELAVEELNKKGGVLGQPFSIAIEDSGNSVTGALDAATRLHSVKHVPVVLGEYSSSITIPLGQYLVKNGLIHLNIGSSSPQVALIGLNSFSLIGLDTIAAKFSAKDVLSMGYKKIAFIAPNGAYGQGISDEFKKDIEAGGGTLVADVLYNPGQSSYQRELQQIQRTRPDVYVYSAYGQEAAIINRNAYELGLNHTPWYGIYLTMCISDTPPQISNGQTGMEVASMGTSGKAFADAYKKKYGFGMKSSYSSYAYDAVMFAAAGIEKAHSDDPAKISAALREVGKTFNGVTGKLALDANGQRTEQPYDKLVVKDGGMSER